MRSNEAPRRIDLLPATQREVVSRLKIAGPMTAGTIAAALWLSPSATRQVLQSLERAGLVRFHKVHREMGGRPAHLYRLTSDGHRLFPSMLEGFGRELTQHLRAEHPEVLSAYVESFLESRAPAGGSSGVERVEAYARENGYLPEVGTDAQGTTVTLRNCPLYSLARLCRETCEAELDLFSRLSERRVSRVSHMLEGESVCTYVLAAEE